MPLRALVVTAVLLVITPTLFITPAVSAAGQVSASSHVTAAAAPAAGPPGDTIPVDTINEFYPEDQAISDCVSSLPRPNCGSKAQGGWRQSLVFVVLLLGLGFIAWRIVASSRAARRRRDRRDA